LTKSGHIQLLSTNFNLVNKAKINLKTNHGHLLNDVLL
jgi:hypothetical protein